MKLSTDCATTASTVEAELARKPDSRLNALRIASCPVPSRDDRNFFPPEIRGEVGLVSWPALRADETMLACVLDARSITWRIASESPVWRLSPLKTAAVANSKPRETARSDSPKVLAISSRLGGVRVEENEENRVSDITPRC